MKPTINIREARKEDGPSIALVHTVTVSAIETNLYTREEIESWATPRSLDGYAELIQTRECFVAEVDDQIAGFGVLNPATSVIDAVYVSPSASGRGIGLRLLHTLEERALSLGLKTLQLNASLNAVPFYRRAGYLGAEQKKYKLQTGVEISCVPMSKIL